MNELKKKDVAGVGYLVYVDGWSLGKRYVWDAAEVDDGGLCDCPNGFDDVIVDKVEAEDFKKEVEAYIKEHAYGLSVGIEVVVKE